MNAATPSAEAVVSARDRAVDHASALLILLAVAVELGIRESFFAISSEAPRLMLIAVLMAITAAAWGIARPARRGACRASRGMVLLAAAAWLMFVGIAWPGGRWTDAAVLLLGVTAAWRFGAARWRLLRRATTVAALIFVFSQPLLAAWRAKDVVWPRTPASPAVPVAAPEITIIVLLDELSAKAADPIAEAMARSGRPVLRRGLRPAGDGTAKVVPALLSGHAFEESKPCGSHMLCSGATVLDFDRIRASRPDIDIVGFYMPYCRIAGLRSCEVLSPSQPYLEPMRWRCAALRRSEALARLEGVRRQAYCATLNGQVWADLGARVEAAVWQAPVWTEGGLLFVHAPLPHPPGEGGEQTLEQHYRANIAKASRLIGDLAQRLAGQDRSYSLVVFSDHPLRGKFWCESTQYRAGCPISGDLLDQEVPLLATGQIAPALREIASNAEIFEASVAGSAAITVR